MSDPKLRAKVKRIAEFEMFYRLSPFWRLLSLLLLSLLFLLFSESRSPGDVGPITEWFFTRELVRSLTVFAPFVWAGPFFLIPFFYAMGLTYELKLATDTAAPLTEARFWRVPTTTWLYFNKILLVLELLSELGCIWVLSEGVFELQPLSRLCLRFEIGVSIIYLCNRVDSLRLVARFVKELEQDPSCFELTQIQERTPNSVPPTQTSIAIPD